MKDLYHEALVHQFFNSILIAKVDLDRPTSSFQNSFIEERCTSKSSEDVFWKNNTEISILSTAISRNSQSI